MGKKEKQFEKEQIVDCETCDGVIPLGFYVGRGDVVCCEECGTEYIVNSRKPLRLLPLGEEDDENDYGVITGYGDDDYDDGRYS